VRRHPGRGVFFTEDDIAEIIANWTGPRRAVGAA